MKKFSTVALSVSMAIAPVSMRADVGSSVKTGVKKWFRTVGTQLHVLKPVAAESDQKFRLFRMHDVQFSKGMIAGALGLGIAGIVAYCMVFKPWQKTTTPEADQVTPASVTTNSASTTTTTTTASDQTVTPVPSSDLAVVQDATPEAK